LNWEIRTLFACDSEYIIKYYGAFLEHGEIKIILEYMDKGSLERILKTVKTIDDVILGVIIYQIL